MVESRLHTLFTPTLALISIFKQNLTCHIQTINSSHLYSFIITITLHKSNIPNRNLKQIHENVKNPKWETKKRIKIIQSNTITIIQI